MRVALVCIAKNEENYLQEWVSYYKKLGFTNVFMYENNWRSNLFDDDKFVVKIPFDGEAQQLNSYNNFVKHHGKDYDWGAFFDVDEFLVLKKHNNISDFLLDYKDYSSVAINWVLFGDNNHTLVVGNNYSVLERFTKRQIGVDKHIKTICKMSANPNFKSPHNPDNLTWVDTNYNTGKGSFNENGLDNVAQLNHFFTKTKEEFKLKIDRGRSDIKNFRNLSDFEPHNINEIEDLTALKFIQEK
jgi:hypothetical protein